MAADSNSSALLVVSPSAAGTFRKKFRKNSGKTPETLSERFLEFPSRVRLGSPKPYNSRHLRLPEHFQNSRPPSTAGDASFFRKWFWKGPLRAGHGIPGSTGGVSDYLRWYELCKLQTRRPQSQNSGNGFRVKTQRVKTSENFSEESNLPQRFRRYPEILLNPVKVRSEKSSEISSANIFFLPWSFQKLLPFCVPWGPKAH